MKTLYIKTDLNNAQWLKYIIEEFIRFNKVEFNIEIVTYKIENASKYLLYYSKNSKNKNSIYFCGEKVPTKDTIRISDDIFIFNNTITYDNAFLLPYDLFWNAFIYLSRLEEYISENSGNKIHSYSINHPRKNKDTFNFPIVNNLFNELEKIISEKFPDLKFGNYENPVIDLSHDVDYIKKTIQLRLKQTAFNIFNLIKNILRPKLFFNYFIKTFFFYSQIHRTGALIDG